MSQGANAGVSELPSFRRILLTTDFSTCSEGAVPFVRLLAEYYRASLLVAHVVPAAEESAPGEAMDESDDQARERMQGFLGNNALPPTTDTVVERGGVADLLSSIIESNHIDLAVVGTHGRHGVGKLMLGSVAERIFQNATCPVLTVGRKARKSWGADNKLSRIVYATSFSDAALQALPYALSLVKASGAELSLVHAVEPSTAGGADYMSTLHERLHLLIPPDARSWCKYDTFVIGGDPAEVILNLAADQNADFIVMSGHRVEGPLYTLQVPMTPAYRVVSRAHCPVLRVRG